MRTPGARPFPRAILAVIVLAIGIAGAEFYAITKFGRKPTAVPAESAAAPASSTAAAPSASGAAPPAAAPVATPPAPLGWVDRPLGESVVGTAIEISGWALVSGGLRAVEGRIGDRRVAARLGLPRPEVEAADPAHRGHPNSGWSLLVDSAALPPMPGADRRRIEIVAIGNNGRETSLGTRSLIDPNALTRWAKYTPPGAAPFHLLPALSGMGLGAANGLETSYANYVSPTTRVGTRIPILYLRTTRGAANDYAFDPDWDVERRCKPGSARRLSDDSLAGVFAYAIDRRLPVLFTLNGGIWADAACEAPEWDVNDKLEQDPAHSQWDEKNQVVGDDHLKNLAGAFESPELARALTLNVYARDVRRYKKRNLQAAARAIVAFARKHPDLYVGITLDADLYVNPFFGEQAWFDYNPGTLRQFRHWLAGTGPYAGRPERGAPDLSAYRRAKALTLADINRIAGRSFKTWSEVDPPRAWSRDEKAPFWNDPWVREWEHFRRHLVDLHYDELSRWLVEVGVSPDRIWSGQGFMAPHASAMPFALRVASEVKNYDSGGMSVEGAKPAAGHIGAILYGESAQNSIRMEGPHSLFGAFASIDPGWAVVEYNSADLRQPKRAPTYADAYRGLREMWNFGARFVSPMAWPGSSGRNVGQPGYDPFTAWRDTPLEEAARDFLLARAGLALGSRLWTFGSPEHADDDGWRVDQGSGRALPGALMVTPDASGQVSLVSPPELRLDLARAWRVVIVCDGPTPQRLRVSGRRGLQEGWTPMGEGALSELEIGVGPGTIEQLRIELFAAEGKPLVLTRLALLPMKR